MNVTEQLLITFSDSPYTVLDAPYDSDVKIVNEALRSLFRKDPRNGGRIGPVAQKKLTNPKERIKVDACCCQVDLPQINLSVLEDKLSTNEQNLYCHVLENPIVLSDLFFPERLQCDFESKIDFGEISYRSGYDRTG